MSVMAARRVLVVDDEQDIRELIVMWLADDERCGSVWQAASLDDAVELAEQQTPDVVLLDFFLARRVCVDELPRIRAACPAAVIIVYTSSRRAAETAGVFDAGANLLVEKGRVSDDEVVELVLGQPQLEVVDLNAAELEVRTRRLL